MAISRGTLIGHYRILRLLGQGGMGEVYLAEDQRLKREVAVKVLSSKLTENPEYLNRFYREATSAAALRHPNICTIFEIGDNDGLPFIVMEHIEGVSLQEKIASGELTLEQILDITIQASDALEEARKKNIVHRDIKSGNIVVSARNQIKILDFGLAKRIHPKQFEPMDTASTDVQITQHGILLGTLAYMSPEQALGKEMDHRSDIFSLGVVFYEMLAGRLPFEGKTTAALLVAIASHPHAPVSRYNPGVLQPVVRILDKMLAKDVYDRYQSPHEVCTDLRAVRNVPPTNEILAKPRPGILRFLWLPLILVGIVVALFVIRGMSQKASISGSKTGGTIDTKTVQASPACYEIETKYPKVIPFGWKNSLGSQDFLYWFHVKAVNNCSDPLHLVILFKVRHGPAVIPANASAEYSVYPGTVLSQKVDPLLEFLSSDVEGTMEVIWRIYNHADELLDTGTARIEILPKTTLDWNMRTPEDKLVSPEFVLASLTGWYLTPDPRVKEQASTLFGELNSDTDPATYARQWFERCYNVLLQKNSKIRIDPAPSFRNEGRQEIQTPGQTLERGFAEPVEAALLLAALSRDIIRRAPMELSLFVIPSDHHGDPVHTYFGWRMKGTVELHALDLGRASQMNFNQNEAESTSTLLEFLSRNQQIPKTLDQKGVFIQQGNAAIALSFDRASRHFSISGLP